MLCDSLNDLQHAAYGLGFADHTINRTRSGFHVTDQLLHLYYGAANNFLAIMHLLVGGAGQFGTLGSASRYQAYSVLHAANILRYLLSVPLLLSRAVMGCGRELLQMQAGAAQRLSLLIDCGDQVDQVAA